MTEPVDGVVHHMLAFRVAEGLPVRAKGKKVLVGATKLVTKLVRSDE